MRYVLLGGGGVLGSGFRHVLSRCGADVHWVRPGWTSPADVCTTLRDLVPRLVAEAGPTTVVWAAGVGSIGASSAQLSTESGGVQALCDGLAALPAQERAGVSVVFASSAGALFGGGGADVVHRDAEPRPVTAYGREKLVQEEALRRFADRSSCRVLVCRLSNVFGLAADRLTPRGLVSTALRATRLRQPMIVYVSPDTRRDYIYNVDAAAVSLRLLETAPAGWSQSLVRDGSTRTVSSVLQLVGAVSGRRVPASYADRPETRLQPPVLRFSQPARSPEEVRRTPMETALRRMVHAPLAA